MKQLLLAVALLSSATLAHAADNEPNDMPTFYAECESVDKTVSVSFSADGDIANVKIADQKQGKFEFDLKNSTDDSYNMSISSHPEDKVIEFIVKNRRQADAAFVHLEMWAIPSSVKRVKKTKYTNYYSFKGVLQGTPDGVDKIGPNGSSDFAHWFQRTALNCTAEDNL